MTVDDFFNSEELRGKIAKYLDMRNVEERFEKSVKDLTANECLIPVLGTQGAGKSSFLNAILFGDVVLPVDADETTCIPTAVKYGENVVPEAYVVMANGVRSEVPCSEEGLSDFVHQEKNPGNVKGVSHIEIVVKNDLLKGGIVFVDLPGVGSITAANQKTTTEYLKKCTAAIFMLRTVPPITQSESIFIQGALPLMGQVFWVQNQWTDESRDEVTEGREHNFNVLKRIASDCRLPETVIKEPSVICVKRALDGAVLNDKSLIEGSGIEIFREAVVSFAKDWRKDVLRGKKEQALELLDSATVAAEEKAKRLDSDADVEREKIHIEKTQMEEALDRNAKLVREARDFLLDRETEIHRMIENECRKAGENLRNGVRDSIDGGLVGGEQLERAYNDYCKREHENLFHVLQPEFLQVGCQIQQLLSSLRDVTFSAPGDSAAEGTNFTSKTQIHEYYGRTAGAAAGIGSAAVLYTVAAASGPVGWGVGLAIGACSLVASLFGGWLGGKAKEVHLERQKEEARRELFRAVDDFVQNERFLYKDGYRTLSSEIETNVTEWMRTQRDAVDAHFKAAVAELQRPAEEKATAAKNAVADAELFKKIKKEMEGV